MTPATATTTRTAQSQTRKEQVVQLLTGRRGEKLTASDVATALKTDVENIRATLKRLYARREIAMSHEMRTYQVGNAVCKHKAALWFVRVRT
ncbi:MAG: hypothetical protein M3436_00845 [Pseudomonadota bacterium]|nr:hypothetical protein [Pseudomonadota bacterium]